MSNKTTIEFSESITKETVKKFIWQIKQICENNQKCDRISIYISSPGGDVDIAIELYNFIRSLECHITTINTSYVNSAAVIIFLAGDERICLCASSFYIHSVSKKLKGIYDIDDLEIELKEMKSNTNKIAELYELSTKKNKAFWKKQMKKGVVISAKEAVKIGLASKFVHRETI